MKLDKCEETILSVIAEMEGELPLLFAEQTTRHLSQCEHCRVEIERQKKTINMFQGQKRLSSNVDLWSEIESRINDKPGSEQIGSQYFFPLLCAILVVYKLFEMIPAQDPGFLFRLLPVIFVAALFYFFNENPFKINTELKLEKQKI